ncbi:hypothetical protein [Billgrantia desiderata]|uniref:hypothetical protein n=1 Tax=Billgrantia desiderata TaxID=52021 RepID=UPI00089E9B37|nr:hypothetical protein [Halomonas desiderata]SEG30093.1 hypothetical protein SAMN04487953_12226 [Halomonas desiderata]
MATATPATRPASSGSWMASMMSTVLRGWPFLIGLCLASPDIAGVAIIMAILLAIGWVGCAAWKHRGRLSYWARRLRGEEILLLPAPPASSESRQEQAAEIESSSERMHEGTIVALGHAHYRHDKRKKMNFFIRLRNVGGNESDVWGIDLARVAQEHSLAAGQEVRLVYEGRQRVIVEEPTFDEAGRLVEIKEISTHRNQWRAESLG